jgi:IS66 C-terminal element
MVASRCWCDDAARALRTLPSLKVYLTHSVSTTQTRSHRQKELLFAGNDDAAANHARLYTLIASAQRHGLDPQAYLTSVLSKIGPTPLSQLNQFMPDA